MALTHILPPDWGSVTEGSGLNPALEGNVGLTLQFPIG